MTTTPAKKAAAKKAAAPSRPANRPRAAVAVSEEGVPQTVRGDGSIVSYTPEPVNDPAKRGRSHVAVSEVKAPEG